MGDFLAERTNFSGFALDGGCAGVLASMPCGATRVLQRGRREHRRTTHGREDRHADQDRHHQQDQARGRPRLGPCCIAVLSAVLPAACRQATSSPRRRDAPVLTPTTSQGASGLGAIRARFCIPRTHGPTGMQTRGREGPDPTQAHIQSLGPMPPWRNWQTRRLQEPLPVTRRPSSNLGGGTICKNGRKSTRP